MNSVQTSTRVHRIAAYALKSIWLPFEFAGEGSNVGETLDEDPESDSLEVEKLVTSEH